MSPHAAHPSLGSVFSAFSAPPDPTRGQGLFASASEAPGDALTAPDGDNAPEDAIAPPIWRRVESLIEERRAAALALTGEALGEAALIEPAPPIWRSVTALRIEVAEMEGAPEAAEQEVAQAYAPTPPIWRMPERAPWRQSAGLALAFSPASSEHSSSHDDELIDLSALAGAPPIWLTWVSAAWPERYAPPEIEESSGADEPLVWSEPPIWRSPMRQR